MIVTVPLATRSVGIPRTYHCFAARTPTGDAAPETMTTLTPPTRNLTAPTFLTIRKITGAGNAVTVLALDSASAHAQDARRALSSRENRRAST